MRCDGHRRDHRKGRRQGRYHGARDLLAVFAVLCLLFQAPLTQILSVPASAAADGVPNAAEIARVLCSPFAVADPDRVDTGETVAVPPLCQGCLVGPVAMPAPVDLGPVAHPRIQPVCYRVVAAALPPRLLVPAAPPPVRAPPVQG